MNYYSEWNPFAAGWLRNLAGAGLIPPGDVDERDMREVRSGDLEGYTQCHWFAGVAGWSIALRLAGFPADRPVWTASFPCQPWSAAGQRRGAEDERHLWPAFAALVGECRPDIILGEQVDSVDALEWIDGVRADLETMQYTFGFAVLPAACVGAPHARHRIFWCAIGEGLALAGQQPSRQSRSAEGPCTGTEPPARRGEEDGQPGRRGAADCFVAVSIGHGVRCGGPGEAEPEAQGVQGEGIQREWLWPDVGSGGCVLGNASSEGRQGSPSCSDAREARQVRRSTAEPGGASAPWDDFDFVWCLDGGIRRVPSAESGIQPMAYGIPTRRADPRMGYLLSRLEQLGHGPKAARRILADARRNRVGRLQGVGNAIVPQVAVLWIRAVMEELGIQPEEQ